MEVNQNSEINNKQKRKNKCNYYNLDLKMKIEQLNRTESKIIDKFRHMLNYSSGSTTDFVERTNKGT